VVKSEKQENCFELKKIEKQLVVLAEGMKAQAFSWNSQARIWELEKKKQFFLKIEEISWKLKSRITWMKEGDKNTKLFHRFASKRRADNSIWQIKNEEGILLYSQEDIANEAVNYFKKAYKREDSREFNDILWGIGPYSNMFNEEDNERLFAEISEEELLAVMKSFKKDKCPGPDDWSIDIFIHFFDLMKNEILGMVEEIRKDSSTFADYRPISLCNVIYKITSKIIAERIRGKLSEHISKEQHGFLC